MILRPYQNKTRELLFDYLCNNEGNPVVCLPTGSGKSVCIADFCQAVIKDYPRIKILVLVHVQELIKQNHEKFSLYHEAGIYSAGLNSRDMSKQVTFAGIQSIGKRADEFGECDIVIVDECHLICHNEEGLYRKFINRLKEINNKLVVIGFTATPFRYGHGLITDKPALFDSIIEPTTIAELIKDGYLAPLKSKGTPLKLKTDGVHKRGGDYIESELQKAVNKPELNNQIIEQVIERGQDKKHWLFFCSGVKHAEDMDKALKSYGIKSACLTGKSTDRDEILTAFKNGEIQALTNCNILTTGFDFPDIDLIALCRPTLSVVLYMQMVGRGMRLKSHTDHCTVLDFAGCVANHGPITQVRTPDKKKKGEGIAPSKECPKCFEIIPAQCKVCPECGHEFPKKEKDLYLRTDDIMGIEPAEMLVKDWIMCNHVGRSGKACLKVTYYPVKGFPIDEYVFYGSKPYFNIYSNRDKKPHSIKYYRDGKFFKIIERKFLDKMT